MPLTVIRIKAGKMTIEGEGFAGEACRDVHRPILEALKIQPAEIQEEMKAEAFLSQEQQIGGPP